jgi:hypothetical protein
MSIRSICDAWIADITANVPGMSDVVTHRYAPWSLENLYADAGERHLAIWPEIELETMQPFDTSGGQLAEQDFICGVWEHVPEVARASDDEAADGAWLDLYELIRARFFVTANIRLGDDFIMRTRFVGGSFPIAGQRRVMEQRFRVQRPYP